MLPKMISMDPPRAQEIDDAIRVRRRPDGTWIVDVMIPDVPSLLTAGCQDDVTAMGKGVTVYRGGSASSPMLPRDMTRRLSLSPDEDRPAIHVVVGVGRDLRTSVTSVARIRHRTAARLSYAQGDSILADPTDPMHDMLREMWELSSLLHAERSASTGARFDVGARVYTNEEGREDVLDEGNAHRSNMIVMEIMILANSAMAQHARDATLPVLFRNHRLRGFVHGDRASAAAELAIRDCIGRRTAANRIASLQHLVQQAELGTECLGHHGLDVPAYAWFTSPLRRYADVVNLRAILGENPVHDLSSLAADLTDIHRRQKNESSEHHGLMSRRLLVKRIARGSHEALKASDVHTIVRALVENPGFDRSVAMKHLKMRMGADDLTGRDIAALIDNSDAIASPEDASFISEWLEAVPARGILLAGFREGLPPRTQHDHKPAGENHKGTLLDLANRNKVKVEFSNIRSGPPHDPMFTVSASWKAVGGSLTASADGRTLRAGEQQASRKLLELVTASTIGGTASEGPRGTRVDDKPKHPKTHLLEIVQSTPGAKVEFGTVRQDGSQHEPSFEAPVEVFIHGRTIRTSGTGASKKEAERRACEAAMYAIRNGPAPSGGE